MTKQEIIELIIQAKELGLKSIEVEGIKVEFNSDVKSSNKATEISTHVELKAEDLVTPPNAYDELTDEEILYWSSSYGQELADARKKELVESLQRKEEDVNRL